MLFICVIMFNLSVYFLCCWEKFGINIYWYFIYMKCVWFENGE